MYGTIKALSLYIVLSKIYYGMQKYVICTFHAKYVVINIL